MNFGPYSKLKENAPLYPPSMPRGTQRYAEENMYEPQPTRL